MMRFGANCSRPMISSTSPLWGVVEVMAAAQFTTSPRFMMSRCASLKTDMEVVGRTKLQRTAIPDEKYSSSIDDDAASRKKQCQ